jgi:hypothetical protein
MTSSHTRTPRPARPRRPALRRYSHPLLLVVALFATAGLALPLVWMYGPHHVRKVNNQRLYRYELAMEEYRYQLAQWEANR